MVLPSIAREHSRQRSWSL